MKNPPFGPGDEFAGKYRILRTLGRGGMGIVYLAQHERLDSLVAIKVLHAQVDQPSQTIARFEREMRAMALVKNPHVTHALDADVLEDGSPYLVMEYLEGRDLRAEKNLRRTIPYPEAVAYVVQACEGVAAVHDVGLVHRDLKPHNLFLTRLDAARCVKVLDFGIAKFLVGGDATLTAQEVSMGTPAYMSPEQLSTPKDITPCSDVWSLGVVLYEIIAGVSPFAAGSPGAVVAAVLLEHPALLHRLVPSVPVGLSQVIARAMEKSPAKRVSSVREFAEELASYGMPTNAVFVDASAFSKQTVPPMIRESSRPELAERIKDEINDLARSTPPDNPRVRPDAVQQLPNLGKLRLPLATPSAPAPALATQQPQGSLSPKAPSAEIETVRPPTRAPSTSRESTAREAPPAPPEMGRVAPASSPQRRHPPRWVLLTLGVVVLALGAIGTLESRNKSTPTGSEAAPQPPTSPAPSAPPLTRAAPEPPAVTTDAPVMTVSAPERSPAATNAAASAPRAAKPAPPRAQRARSSSSVPGAPLPGAPPPTPAGQYVPIPAAADGKPLHL